MDPSSPPQPLQLLSNGRYHVMVTAAGGGYSQWNRVALTRWHEDAGDRGGGSCCYLRDWANGQVWSTASRPLGHACSEYDARFSPGLATWHARCLDIESRTDIAVAPDDDVELRRLRISNRSAVRRTLTLTSDAEVVLEAQASDSAHPAFEKLFVETDVIDLAPTLVCSRRPRSPDEASPSMFHLLVAPDAIGFSHETDRMQFIGRGRGTGGSLRRPGAMGAERLCGAVGLALDPSAALRVHFELNGGQTREIIFRIGAGVTPEEAAELAQRWRPPVRALEALAAVKQHWTRTLGAVQVRTPDKSFDLLANGWLAYQALACRLWARNAFYRSSGAFGFRDQLQDVMALVHAALALVREHLLRCASRQFPEGDVQHWWHPPSGRGVRTRCSDDYLWLPLATCRNAAVTGDAAVLDEPVSFPGDSALKAGQASCYELPTLTDHAESLYAHCTRAIGHGLRFGVHGLPLKGAGDWNDGMNLVGAGGRGGKCLARLLPVHGVDAVCRPRRPARRHGLRRALRRRGGAPAGRHRAQRLGRCLVSPWLVRRRVAAGHLGHRRMPHRGDRTASSRRSMNMQIGMIGLGRMGASMVTRLLRGGHDCVVHDRAPEEMARLVALGATSAATLQHFVDLLETPRAVWMMVPTAAVDGLLDQLAPLLQPGDIDIDGGNSHYHDDLRRAASLAASSIAHVDVGTSGGVAGLDRGYCLMIGGGKESVQRIAPVFATLAPGAGTAAPTPGRRADQSSANQGWLHCGPHGAGHFVKMVHNGIEYGVMAACAEGLNILHNVDVGLRDQAADAETTPLREPAHYRYQMDLPEIAEVWRRGSVIGSWLLDLTASALATDPTLAGYEGRVSDSGEGRWTVQAAIDEAVPAPVLSAALYARFGSRGDADFANRVRSAMRHEFGGHVEKPAPRPPTGT